MVYEAGWVQKPGWHWRSPWGGSGPTSDSEPAVHLTFDEAQAFCRWSGGQLPTDAQWLSAAYTEQRAAPPPPFTRGSTYRFPTGDTPEGAQCLDDCGDAARTRAVRHGVKLWRGHGHALAGSTPAGVNGLHEMGGNAWEWVDEPPGPAGQAERRTRGGTARHRCGPIICRANRRKRLRSTSGFVAFAAGPSESERRARHGAVLIVSTEDVCALATPPSLRHSSRLWPGVTPTPGLPVGPVISASNSAACACSRSIFRSMVAAWSLASSFLKDNAMRLLRLGAHAAA